MTGFYYTTNSYSKSVISEGNTHFKGYIIPDQSNFIIGLGAVTTASDTNFMNIRGNQNKVMASNGSCFVGSDYYGSVPLSELMKALIDEFKNEGKDLCVE